MKAKKTNFLSPTIVVTRHKGLVDYLLQEGLIPPDIEVTEHVNVGDVKGHHVIGVLPMSIAAHALSITEIPLSLPPTMRGRELDAETIRLYAGKPRQYVVREVSDGHQ